MPEIKELGGHTVDLSIANIKELTNFAQLLAKQLEPPFIVCLRGDLGVGKTTIAKHIINHLSYPLVQEVTSPTFNIVHIYDTNKGPVWHLDLYRIQSVVELKEIGIEDAMSNIMIVEWPEIIVDLLGGKDVLDIKMAFGDVEGSRNVNGTFYGANGKCKLDKFK
ncbi:tRNA (adenosine(37)-N6)-threonylcarbamoyltransferase complex ATPase subunit type 1 TsaE [Rickettsiales endosymbiont of Peranema trichophorum]|uniref:tRNA (adenosine(37)-N6)-threonylcarbamoyltransferase complex ATPase subunit type 1 TsaE n=1 Tax=Rickettsiales endosymbiont of Peranema trichophorum TaxID=2486577 RepID=UPI0010232364|nr:tRNA (adenosine(37)-N6)-threonylcarbamoyltransferase complex ATPase subunit type 1 TsaE [Rickettsiales endosymbiont of Peranema trichophorum]RZI47206.1 tRNA (adenosine(37)-N6)-threonylcarbamoyltransferase complex ATPase subunit type 1 TsaE [Rickettsiales endosymbiont of Peranema trichophorum]